MKKFFKTHVKLCIAVLALMVVTVGGTLALIVMSSSPLVNQFTVASVDTQINETMSGQGGKQVSIKNNGPSDAYVRARIMVSGVEEGQVVIVPNEPTGTGINENTVYLVMKNNETWQQAEGEGEQDDFCYYLGVVKENQSTDNLLEKVVFGKDLQNDQEFLAGFNITVYHESVLAIEKPAEGQSATLDMVKRAFTNAVPTTTPGT